MPSKSKRQARLMRAVAHNPKFAKKVGIPQSVGRDFNEADKRVGKFAEGGKVATTRQALEALRAKYKLPGTFSTLDEAIRTAKQKKMKGTQWAQYLAPGRQIDRSGVKFGLKAEELDYAGPQLREMLKSEESLTSDQLLAALRTGRPRFGMELHGSPKIAKKTGEALGSRFVADPELGRKLERIVNSYGKLDREEYIDLINNVAAEHGLTSADVSEMAGVIPKVTEKPVYTNKDWRTPRTTDYMEAVTTMPGLKNFSSSHFAGPTMSWSRSSSQGPLRILDEIQSDVHQMADKPIDFIDETVGYAPDKDTALRMSHGRQKEIAERYFKEANLDPEKWEVSPYGMSGTGGYGVHSREDPNKLYYPAGFYGVQGSIDPAAMALHNKYSGAMSKTMPQYDMPFKNNAWIDRELANSLLLSNIRRDPALALVSPKVVGSRYADNPGLGAMYKDIVDPAFQRLARKYGIEATKQNVNTTAPADRLRSTLADLTSFVKQEEALSTWQLRNLSASLDRDVYGTELGALQDISSRAWKDSPQGKLRREDIAVQKDVLRQLSEKLTAQAKARGKGSTQEYSTLMLPESAHQRIEEVGVPLFAEGGRVLPARIDDEPWADTYIKRPLSGLASMWGGVDPETGEFVSPPVHNLKRAWGAGERRRKGQPKQKRAPLGIVESTKALPGLAYMLSDLMSPVRERVGVPDPGSEPPAWVTEAEENESRIVDAAREAVGVDEPRGFSQNMMESAGVMAGQLPIPGSSARKLAPNRSLLKRLGGSAAEWFGPTIDPKLSNYLKGTAFGGAIGTGVEKLEEHLDKKMEAANQEQWIAEAMDEILQEEMAGDETSDDEALAELGYAEGGRVGKARGAIEALRGSLSKVEDVQLRKAKIDEALQAIKGTTGLPKEARVNIQTSVGGLSDAAADPLPERRKQRFGDYERNVLRLLERGAPLLQPRPTPTTLPPIDLSSPPPALPPPTQVGGGRLTPEEFERVMLKKPTFAEGGKVLNHMYRPAPQSQKVPGVTDPRGTPLSQDWYEHYGEGPEQLFLGDRTVKLPEDWAPVRPTTPTPPKTGGGSSLSGIAPLLGLGIGVGQDVWNWWQNRDKEYDIDPSILEGAGDTSDTNRWIEDELSKYPEPNYDPTWWDTTKQVGGGALDVYSGLQQGGFGGASDVLSGAGRIVDAMGYDQYGNYLGAAGNTLGGLGDIYSGIQQGDARGYMQAGTGIADLADTLGYGNAATQAVGDYVPYVGAALNAVGALEGGIDSKEEAAAVTNSAASAMAAAAGAGPAGLLFGALSYGIGALGDKYDSTKVGPVTVTDAMGNVPAGAQLVRTEPDGTKVYEHTTEYNRGTSTNPEMGTFTTTTRVPPVNPEVNSRIAAAGVDPATISETDLRILNHLLDPRVPNGDQAFRDYLSSLQSPIDLAGIDLSNINDLSGFFSVNG